MNDVDQSAHRPAVITVAIANTAKRLGLTTEELGVTLGVSEASAARLMHDKLELQETGESWALALLLIRMYRDLLIMVGDDDALAVRWFRSPNHAFDNECPCDVIRSGSGLANVCSYLSKHQIHTQ